MSSRHMSTAKKHFAITKSDVTTFYADALYVGGAGDVACKDKDGTNVTWTVPAGGYILCQTTAVMSTNTTATGIVGLLF